MADLMVKVTTGDYDTWLNAFVSAETGLVDAGINQWTVYQDTWNSNIVMIHFIAEDIDRALAFFQSDAFKEIDARSGAAGREFFVGQKPGAAKPAAKRAAAKPAAKPAAKKPAAKPAAAKATVTTTEKPASTRTRKKTT